MAALKRCGIYSITCTKTQGCYVGQTERTFEDRWEEHRSELERDRHKNRSLQAIANRHGVSSLKFKVLEECDRAELDQRELHWIAKQGTWNAKPSQSDANRMLRGSKDGIKAKRSKKSKAPAWGLCRLGWMLGGGLLGWFVFRMYGWFAPLGFWIGVVGIYGTTKK